MVALSPKWGNGSFVFAVRSAEIETRVPWHSVKKTWNTKRQAWLAAVQASAHCDKLAKQLLKLENALKQEVFASSWAKSAETWRAQLRAEGQTGAQLELALEQLETAIEWGRLLLTPRLNGIRVPSQLDETVECPPDGMPQVAVRMLLLLRSMGVRKFAPGVVVQLLETMHRYTADVLVEAAACSRLRSLTHSSTGDARARQHGRSAPSPLAPFDDRSSSRPAPVIELRDLELAVRAACMRLQKATHRPAVTHRPARLRSRMACGSSCSRRQSTRCSAGR